VVYEKDTVLIEATCDSLQLLCWSQEKELIRIRNDTEKEKLEVKQDASKAKNKCLLIGFICGACVVIVFKKAIKKLKQYVK